MQFNDGSIVQLVLKDLSREAMVEKARRARPEFLYEPQREINAYRRILPHGPAGAPACYGVVIDALAGRYWLLLERVDGLPLWQFEDISIWEQTAAWIARFHSAFSPLQAQQLGESSGALAYDEDFYWGWLCRAQRFAAAAPEKRRVLDDIARRYARVVEHLTKLPRTLIHGEFYASNVIIEDRAKVRVCPVDWEMAALAPGLIDLAALTAGWGNPTRCALARAYLVARGDNVAGAGDPAALPPDFMEDLDCCRVHLAVRMLGWSDDWEPPPGHAHNWLAEAARLSNRLRH